MSAYRSDRLFDLNGLVDEAKRAPLPAASVSSSSRRRNDNNGGSGNHSVISRPSLPPAARGREDAAADDASMSSFSRSIARVTRAVEGRDNRQRQQHQVVVAGGGGRGGGGGGSSVHSGGRLLALPPPSSQSSSSRPLSRSGSVGSGGRGGGRTSGGSRSIGGGGHGSDAADRLMQLVQELSQEKGHQQQPPPSSMSVRSSSSSSSFARRRLPPPGASSSSLASGESGGLVGGYIPRRYVDSNDASDSGGSAGRRNSNRDDSNGGGGGVDAGSRASKSFLEPGGLSVSPGQLSRMGSRDGSVEPTGFVMPPGQISRMNSNNTSSMMSDGIGGVSEIYVGGGGGSPSIVSGMSGGGRRTYGGSVANGDPSIGSGGSRRSMSSGYVDPNLVVAGGTTPMMMLGDRTFATMSDGGRSGGSGPHSGGSNASSQYSQSQLIVGDPYMHIPGGGGGNAMMYAGHGGYGGHGYGGGLGSDSIAGTSHLGASSRGTNSGRSLANSAAIIPRAKFSWADESLGTQSTIFTRRSVGGGRESVPQPHREKEGSKVVEGRIWASFAWIITFMIPNKCIMRPTKDAKQAWREKVALFLIMVSCSVFFVGVFGFVPLLLCEEDLIFSIEDIWLQTGESWVVVHGIIYDVNDLINRHPGGVKGIVDYLGKDASRVFPRLPPVYLPQKCLDMKKVSEFNLDIYTPENNFTNPTCQSFSELDILLGVTCHTFAAGTKNTSKFIGDYERGLLSHTTVGLKESGIDFTVLYDRVYDVTNYAKAIRENQEPTMDNEEAKNLDNNPAAYLTPTLNKVIMNSLGSDATELYEALFGSSEYIACLEEMFYAGLLDDQFDTFCYTLNIMMYVMLLFVASLMVIQFIASMVFICPRHRTYSEEDVMSPVMVMVPCYNEGDNELRKTIKSVLNTSYPDENKVLFMVADGVVTGNGEDMSTPEHLANILGFDIDEFEDDTFEYNCIGVVHTKNRARVYHGILQKGHKFLKYITVVKCGLPEEAMTSAKPGNRGKRDSQLVIMGYYNRIHYGRELTELDSAIQRAMVDLNLQADMVRFLMAIDADTRVDTMSITHMVYGMDKKEKVLALCGETKVDNKASSWVTMIQVFEYYNSHHLKKAFEAAFGCVTCLPGCFTMYRVIADDGTPLLPGDGVLYEYSRNDIETLHEKNLYHLGEDRMLTTLLLKYYPDRSLTFIPEAACWTIVPHTFRILLSQRRRWINSTVHNMFELLKVDTMCGVCCVSMKVVVFIDLIATMILPASYVYAMYLIFLVMFEDLPVSMVLLILYGIIMGVQVVVFILRSRWEYMWWFFIYFTVGLPVFYLILPTYSFWNMDDFSWGKTRAVGGSAAAGGATEDDDEEEDDDDDGYKKRSRGGYENLNNEDGSHIPSAVKDLLDHSTTSSSSRSTGDDSDSDRDEDSDSDRDDDSDSDSDSDSGSDSESSNEYSESQAESAYVSRSRKA